MKLLFSLSAGLTLLVCATPLDAQDILVDFQAGRELLARALAFQGLGDSATPLRGLAVTLEGGIRNPEQGYRAAEMLGSPLPPAEGYRLEVLVDFVGQRLHVRQDQAIRGGLQLRFDTVHDSGMTWQAAVYAGTHTVGEGSFGAAVAVARRWVPAVALRAAASNVSSVARVGASSLEGATDVIAFSWDDGTRDRLHIRRADGRLLALEALAFDRLLGTDRAIFEYRDWQRMGPLRVPSRVVLRRHWGAIAELVVRSHVVVDPADPAAFAPPSGTTRISGRIATRRVEVRVWEVSGIGGGLYRAQFVELDAGVVAFEAPLSIAVGRRIVQEIRSATDGKPITHVVLSHYHTDHTGGVRAFVEAGATIVVAPENVTVVERLGRAPFPQTATLGDDTPIRRPDVRTVSPAQPLVIGGTEGVVIHNLGATPHVESMLVLEAPGAGVVVNGDLFSRLSVFNDTFRAFGDWLAERQSAGLEWVLGTHHEPVPVSVIVEAARGSRPRRRAP